MHVGRYMARQTLQRRFCGVSPEIDLTGNLMPEQRGVDFFGFCFCAGQIFGGMLIAAVPLLGLIVCSDFWMAVVGHPAENGRRILPRAFLYLTGRRQTVELPGVCHIAAFVFPMGQILYPKVVQFSYWGKVHSLGFVEIVFQRLPHFFRQTGGGVEFFLRYLIQLFIIHQWNEEGRFLLG